MACNTFSKAFQCLEMVLPWAISLIRGSGGLGRKEAIIFGRSASPLCRLPLINQTEGPQLGKERGLSWPYLSFGLSLDKIAGLQITGGVTLSPTERQYGNMVIKYDLISQPTHMASHPFLCANPTGLQHGTSCMIRSLRFPIPNGGRGHLGTKYSEVQST